ncbi:MAG: hypothetical protein BA863_07990 [Desulfovibrio sp. S3730MH75]|nr:MAG: hypothetical protein BA863_07990 [Desulfovibrio sp. S3730MH75]
MLETAIALRQNRRYKKPPFTLRERLDQREEELQAIEAAKQAEEAALDAERTLIMDNVFSAYCEAKQGKKSLGNEQGYYRNWIGPNIGTKKLDEIVILDLERIKKKMTTAGRAPRSIQYIKSIVRQVYNFAAERGIYSGAAPTTHFMKKLKMDNKRKRYLSPEEAGLLLDKIKEASLTTYRVSLLSINSGMRFGEIVSLQWQHVNIANRSIMILDPKNEEDRSAFMNDEVLRMFDEMETGAPDEPVFPAKNGTKMTRISETFAKAVKELGLNDGITDRRMKVVFHSLRHSCASRLVNSGVELPVIAKILGHKTIAMTMRYSHVNDVSVRDAMRLLDQQQPGNNKKVANIDSGS